MGIRPAFPTGREVREASPDARSARVPRLATGPVNLVLIAPDLPCEVELALPGEWPVTPQIAGAIKAAQGVVEVEEF